MDLINRQDAIDAVADSLEHVFVEYKDVAKKMINKVPSAEPEPKTGKWIDDGFYIICSACNKCEWQSSRYKNFMQNIKYCPNCGAKMENSQ